MSQKRPKRIIRSTPLTPQEAARDEALRERIREEFPPAASSQPATLTTALRAALQGCSRPLDEVAAEAHISPRLVQEFADGRRDLHLALAERLANAIGLQVSVSS
jgi:hypothetical protein